MADEHHDDEIHLPSPSFQPLITSLGVALLLAGLISQSFLWRTSIMCIGFTIAMLGIWLWVKDAIDEYRNSPD